MLDLQRIKVRTERGGGSNSLALSAAAAHSLSFRVEPDALGSIGTVLRPEDLLPEAAGETEVDDLAAGEDLGDSRREGDNATEGEPSAEMLQR